MTVIGLAHKNAWRKPGRTLLLILSVTIAFVIYAVLQSFLTTFTHGVDTQQDRLVVTNRASAAQPLPYRYLSVLDGMEGVDRVAFNSKLRGFVETENNIAVMVGVDSARMFDLFGDELGLTPELIRAFNGQRDGVLVGRMLARSMGWRQGDRVTVTAFGQKQRDGARHWRFAVKGIFDGKEAATDTYFALMHYDFFNTARAKGTDTVDQFVVRLEPGLSSAALAPVLDARFANSAAPTRTQAEKQFLQSFMRQIADLNRVVGMVVVAALFTILMIVVNTMAFAVRERTFEIGVLKTIGFSRWRIMALILSESLFVFLFGGGLGVLTGWGLCLIADPAIGLVFSLRVGLSATMLMIGLGMVSGLLPALTAMRIPIIQTFRAR